MLLLLILLLLCYYYYYNIFLLICRRIELDVQLPEFEDEIFCSVKFPNINDTMTSKGYITEHPCVLEFRSLKPVSMTNLITILETTSGTRYK